jgi:hypothetical protein
MVTIEEAPTAKELSEQFTGPVPLQIPWSVCAKPKVTPDGNVSVRVTFVALAGPLFVTVTR